MRVAVFSTRPYDRTFLKAANEKYRHEITYFEPRLGPETATLAEGMACICVFVNDQLDAEVLKLVAKTGTRLVALRSAGFNHVDLATAQRLGLKVVRVPAYSPHAVAEHTVALLLTLNRKIHRAFNRVREGNFALDGLLGCDLNGQTVGVVGTGKIGALVAKIMSGFGCRVIAYDKFPNPECQKLGVSYTTLRKLLAESDIITLHCPLTPETHHVINQRALARMKTGVALINTSRGALIDTRAVIAGLKSGKVAYLGLDVYEEEADLFFEDLSGQVIQDDVFARLLTFPNVLITGHQAFFTRNALHNIADTTLANISAFEKTGACVNEVNLDQVRG
jgi:D-lactate dehydrogenase